MKRILIIEDDFYIRDIYYKSLSEADYQVDIAVDGTEGLKKIKGHTYDLILLDIMLPKLSGIDLLKIFRKPGSPTVNTPIYLITNLGQDNIIQQAFKIGADGYLLKAQLDPHDLVKEVDILFRELESVNK